ncbi:MULTISPECIES: CusA/CzcA family heavy metal efflux RND transporter [Ignavibacterium]|jgi:cobalt-zinc-cadmium resistance protein CzcA|uniref:efflux RND transporter permease subunit n=2 Tax=Ignavibacteriaceae TaxID=795749 RepID=UPI0025C2ED6D|nr:MULTISPECIES: CusA/CzcA family heavy metal efflux RND transporter [Ignavibacterium]MBI5661553.1 efflux RND transporter permease subunit [Ignavibacterium album]
MINKIILFAVRQRMFVMLGVIALIIGGIFAANQLPIDAVPDITTNQVQIFTVAPALAPQEIERLVSYPIEVAMQNLPDIEEVRSVSKFGLSAVTVIFKENVDTYFGRQLVFERLQEAKGNLPKGLEPELGPVTTGLGEVYQYQVVGEGYTPMELRSIQDWIISKQLAGIPGLAEVNTFGGELKQYQVQIDPQKLLKYNLSIRDVIEAVEKNNANAPGGYIEHKQEQYIVVGEGLAKTISDIENIIVKANDGIPIFVKDVAQVQEGAAIRQGAATLNGKTEIVAGMTMMLKGENARLVTERVKERVKEIEKNLPPGVQIIPFYDRTNLVEKTIRTVIRNLTEGGLLVIIILFLLLMNLRGGFIVASVIPLSMLFALIMMKINGISGNLMSLGAIDFGIIVDGAVVLMENAIRKLHERQHSAGIVENVQQTLISSFLEVGRPLVFGVSIIIIVYLPILTLQGTEGKMFKPMAYTVVFALLGALFLTLTYVPVASTFLFKKGKVSEKESPVIKFLKPRYNKTLLFALKHKIIVVTSAALIFIASLLLFTRLGGEFIPTLDEGDILIELRRLPSISLTESIHTSQMLEAELKSIPEVISVVTKTGRPEIATDPMSIYQSDVYIKMLPREEWKTAKTKDEMIAKMTEVMNRIPGIGGGFSQPIEMRFNELIAGVRSDVGVKIFGEDLDTLARIANDVAELMQGIKGSADIRVQQTEGLPQLRIVIDRNKISRYGINVADVNILIETALAGTNVGKIYEGEKQFDLVVKLNQQSSNNIESIQNLLVPTTNNGNLIRLGDVADFMMIEGPAEISHSAGRRMIVTESNVRERDLQSYVEELQTKIDKQIYLPVGYQIKYGGEFENLERATERLYIVVPIALGLIFILLFVSVNSIRQAMIIFTGIPFAVVGGVVALWIRDIPFSISAGVGFIALFGVAVLNGVVMLTYYNTLIKDGMNIRDAVIKGSEIRLRPVITTALVASLGFIPMAISTSPGAEVQRPLATVVIGGLITSTLLTLVVLPTIFEWLEKSKEEREI